MDAKERFSDRVENYIKYRPGYPQEIIAFLRDAVGLMPAATVADVGSGTGLLARLFLEYGNRVFGVEPNAVMREAGHRLLRAYGRFHPVCGTAEATTLRGKTVNLVAAGQAFHWFDPVQARAEFQRILVPDGQVVLIWNDRKIDATPFLADYDALLREEGTDYNEINHRNVDDVRLSTFFGPEPYGATVFPNRQEFDWDGLYGRAMSSSYVPAEGHPDHTRFTDHLREIYQRHAVADKVTFEYDTCLFYGHLT